MPIRLVNKDGGVVGTVGADLVDSATNFDGLVTDPLGRTGSINANLFDFASNLVGLFDAQPNRTGTIAAAVADITSAIVAQIGTGTVSVGALSQDAVTLEQIALYLPTTGAVDQLTTASVEYKLATSDAWLAARSLWRLQPQLVAGASGVPGDLVDGFAGTIFRLLPGNTYDVRVTVTEPGVGVEIIAQQFSTRSLPPVTGPATIAVTTESALLSAVASASPNDVIEISGAINMATTLEMANSGIDQNSPITIRGDDRDTAVLVFPGTGIDLNSVDWVVFENFTLQGNGVDAGRQNPNASDGFRQGSVGGTATGCTIRNMRITGFDLGFEGFDEQNNFTIYDNIWQGNNPWTQAVLESSDTWDDDGIRIGGAGNCIFHNTLSDYGDALSFRRGSDTDIDVIASFMYRNKIPRNGDDCFEAEYSRRNCGIYDNEARNSGGTFLSVDGIYAGPLYFFGNRLYNCSREAIKNGDEASGVLIYHNTLVKPAGKLPHVNGNSGHYMVYWSLARIYEWELQNNLLLWEGPGAIWRTDGGAQYTPRVATNNGWGRNGKILSYSGVIEGDLATVNAELSPVHDNDFEIVDQAEVFEVPVVFGSGPGGADYAVEVTTDYTLELKSGVNPAVGSGVIIPNISTGTDVGAIQRGATPPVTGNTYTNNAPTTLSIAAAGLAAGGNTNVIVNPNQRPLDIQWMTRCVFYDETRRELQYMGKPQSGASQNYSHYTYTEEPEAWTTSGLTLFPGIGHIWATTFDPDGNYYFRRQGDDFLRIYDRASQTWGVSSTSPTSFESLGTNLVACIGWHPNLFGAGVPGVFIWGDGRMYAYNPATDTFSNLTPAPWASSNAYASRTYGQAVYMPSTDQLICFATPNNSSAAVLVDAGAGLSSDVVTGGLVSETATPPVPVYGGGNFTNTGKVVPHPSKSNTLLLIEEAGSSRYWESSDFGATWVLQGSTHPFQGLDASGSGEFTIGDIQPYGVVVGISSSFSGGEVKIWKPDD